MTEQRHPSTLETTSGLAPGKLLTVPAAPPTGPIPDAPIVAATTQTIRQSVTLRWLAALPFVDFAVGQIEAYLQVKHARPVVILVMSIYLGWRHIYQNKLTKAQWAPTGPS